MKKIVVSAICVVMCCVFILPLAAETDTTSFNLSGVTLTNICRYDFDGNLFDNQSFSLSGVQSGNTWTFSPNYYQLSFLYPDHTFISTLRFDGAWESVPKPVDEYLWFTISLDNVFDYVLYFSAFNMQQIKLTLGDLEFDNYALSQTSDSSYLLTFQIPLSDIDYDFLSMTSFTVSLPVTPVVEEEDCQLAFQLSVGHIKLKYSFPAISSGDVDLIVNDLGTIKDTLGGMSGNIDLILNDVSDIKALTEAIEENQQVTIDEIRATREVLEQLPAELAEALRDIEVGDPYDKSLDTSDIAAYESAYDKVMDEVDVDQVVSIMDGGISLNQDGMYNDQSFDSVSGLMTNIIEATGLMPLIILTLTFGLACFIIGRSGKL